MSKTKDYVLKFPSLYINFIWKYSSFNTEENLLNFNFQLQFFHFLKSYFFLKLKRRHGLDNMSRRPPPRQSPLRTCQRRTCDKLSQSDLTFVRCEILKKWLIKKIKVDRNQCYYQKEGQEKKTTRNGM